MLKGKRAKLPLDPSDSYSDYLTCPISLRLLIPPVYLSPDPLTGIGGDSRDVVIDNQLRLRIDWRIPTVELDVVSAVVVVVIFLEPQAELGGAGLVDVLDGRAAQADPVPTRVFFACDHARIG